MSQYAQVNVKFGADISQFSTAMQNAARQMQKAGQQLQDVGKSMTMNLTAPIVALGAASLYAFGQIDALKRGLISFAGSAEAAEAEFSKLREVAKLPGIGLEEAVKGSINLQAIGMSADDARTAMMAFGNAIATVGGGRENFDLAIRGFGQLQNASKPLQQDLYQIANQLPQVNKLMIEAFGTNRAEDLAELGMSGKQLADFLITKLGELPKVTGGIKNSFENMGDSVKIALAGFGQALDDNFDISGKLTAFADFIGGLTESFKGLSPFMQKTILVVVGLVAAVGPLLLVFGSLVSIFPAVIAGFAVISTVAPYLFAIGAAVALLIKYREPLGNFFGEAIQYLKDFKEESIIIGGAIDYIVFQLGKLFSEVKTILKSIFIISKTILGGIAQLFNSWANIVKAVWSGDFAAIPSLIKDFLSSEKENAISGFKDLVQTVKDGYNDVYGEAQKQYKEGAGTVLKMPENPFALFKKEGSGTVLRNGNTKDPITKKANPLAPKKEKKHTATEAEMEAANALAKKYGDENTTILNNLRRLTEKEYDGLEQTHTVGWEKLNTATNVGATGFTEKWNNFGQEFKNSVVNFSEIIAIELEHFVEDTLVSFFDKLGTNIGEQKNPFDDLGLTLLDSVGSFMKKIGALFITMGVSQELFNNSLKSMNPYGMIAAGAALVAAGAAVTAASRGGLEGSKSGGSGGYRSSSSGASEDMTLTTRIDGRDLVLSGQRTSAIGRR